MVRAAVADARARAGPQRCLKPEDLVLVQIFSMHRVQWPSKCAPRALERVITRARARWPTERV